MILLYKKIINVINNKRKTEINTVHQHKATYTYFSVHMSICELNFLSTWT